MYHLLRWSLLLPFQKTKLLRKKQPIYIPNFHIVSMVSFWMSLTCLKQKFLQFCPYCCPIQVSFQLVLLMPSSWLPIHTCSKLSPPPLNMRLWEFLQKFMFAVPRSNLWAAFSPAIMRYLLAKVGGRMIRASSATRTFLLSDQCPCTFQALQSVE